MPPKINQLVNQSLCDVVVVVDAGLSGSKNIWMPWPVSKAELMMMGPELLEVGLNIGFVQPSATQR